MKISNSVIGVTRSMMVGDAIAGLVVSNWIAKSCPESFQAIYLDLKCSHIAPLFFNHENIKEIRISEKSNRFTKRDQGYFKQYGLAFAPFAPLTDCEYYNKMTLHRQLFIMNRNWPDFTYLLNVEKEYDDLTVDEKCPKLVSWFLIPNHKKFIAIWPEAGHNNKDQNINLRSPKKEFWVNLIKDLNKIGYKVLQFGIPGSEFLGDLDNDLNIRNCLELSLFDAVRESLGCDLRITTDSGISHVLNAYGSECVCLYTNYLPNHISNFDAMVPLNYKNNLKLIFGKGGINNISKEDILEFVKNSL